MSVDVRKKIEKAINAFSESPLFDSAIMLFDSLGYNTEAKQNRLFQNTVEGFLDVFPAGETGMDIEKAQTENWRSVELLFQLTAEELGIDRKVSKTKINDKIIESYLFFAIELKAAEYKRGQLSKITRELNRAFVMPVMVLFKYGNSLTLSVIERRLHKRDETKDVLEKVTLIKDINIENPHRAHIDILFDLSLDELRTYQPIENFVQLHNAWQNTLSISALNKKFYLEIIEWFNRATAEIKLPGQLPNSEKHKDFTIRLIARLIFIWFLKELKVVKEELLVAHYPSGDENKLIKPKKKGTSYYKFVLQNLFFNALNCEQKERDDSLFNIYASNFNEPDKIEELISFSPYLNGGLFDIHQNDGDPLKINNAFAVPDDLFLDKEIGLNSILAKYKFTIAENTPLEEEIAVDPEMLGRIFENLLAEQSDDTKEAARKNAGAFYTPRPVVSYMCRSILLKHLDVDITEENAKAIIHKLLDTKVFDPACGSGAFPMGMLEEMLQVLESVDPNGLIWISEMMKSKDQDFLEHINSFIADKQIRYVKKLGLLRNCLFGIDLLEYAIEITKLRCWLSLIVEQKVDFTKPNFNLKPLPNLEFKFYKKNSLFRYYKDQNLNNFIDFVDNEDLLQELHNLENQYFITKSDRHGTKEEIKQKIIALLEKVVDSKSAAVQKDYNAARTKVNTLRTQKAKEAEIKRAQKKAELFAKELADLATFKESIKDYFIERVVFPGIFNKKSKNPGFDIVIGNPPYVNTKLITKMGLSAKLQEEYNYVDDLYNHFTIRGLDLLKKGGLLTYITSDTFLTLQTKKNMRMEFLGIPLQDDGEQKGLGFDHHLPECRLLEIINTPKAFSALVDTAIFSVKKEEAKDESELQYIDLRKPNAAAFGITEEEWQQIKSSKENIAGWERILDKTFSALGHTKSNWIFSHSCDKENVFRDEKSALLKYKLALKPYKESIGFAIFSPTPYNCQLLEKIIKPARPVFDKWWSKIETSRDIENNRDTIQKYLTSLKADDVTLVGITTDGGQGLATGNNGHFVGYREESRFAERCRQTRITKLWVAINEYPSITKDFKQLKKCNTFDDVFDVLESMKEPDIWQLFDGIKEEYGLRVFGKGYIYRIIPASYVFDVGTISEKQKLNGIKGKRTYVPYDKGDKEGNRWYLETPYLIDWSESAVSILSTDERARWQGYQFFFRNGFCWSDVLNPNSQYIKCRLKGNTVNDVKSMSLYDELGVGDKYFVTVLNSFLGFKILREFLNSSVAIQINDIRKLPIKIPSKSELSAINKLFDRCISIKKKYFAEKITRQDAKELLKPIESEVDRFINKLYGIDVEEVIEDSDEEEMLVDELEEVDE